MHENMTALVIDDSPSMREYIQAILRDELGFNKIQTACCADEAIDLINADSQHEIRWVISDWEMPGRPARDLFDYVRSRADAPDVKLMLLTATSDADAEALAMDIQADDFLSKPFNSTLFVKKFRRMLSEPERRSAARVKAYTPCHIDLGFDDTGKYSAELINISTTGCLVRMPLMKNNQGQVYDFGEIVISLRDESQLNLNGQIVRIERDTECLMDQLVTKVAFEFRNIETGTQQRLHAYIDEWRLMPANSSQRPS